MSFLLFVAAGCGTGKNQRMDTDALVRIAIVKFVNASHQSNYDYLGESLTDATQGSMDKKFVYGRLPTTETQRFAEELDKKNGVMSDSRLRDFALDVDVDLVIFGSFKTTAGKKGDGAQIVVTIFRADKGISIGNVTRTAVISAGIFKDIESIAADLVRQIAEYRKAQNRGSEKNELAEVPGEKIHLTRDSLNMLPFIPPVF